METSALDARSAAWIFLKRQNKSFNFSIPSHDLKTAAYETHHSSMAAYAIYIIPNSFSEFLPGPAHRRGAGLFKIRSDADFRASVIVQGSKTGTSTNADGRFSITAKEGDTLVITGVGITARKLPSARIMSFCRCFASTKT